MPRPSLRATGTTIAAAVVLVGGANLASYAATGNPLILGHGNAAHGTTGLANTGKGPALSLHSAKSSAPLAVNSSKLVKHLNAAQVGGQSAQQISPNVWRFQVGRDAKTETPNLHFFTFKLPKGSYQVQEFGIFSTGATTGNDTYICATGALKKILANDSSGIFTYDIGTITESPVLTPWGSGNTITIGKAQKILYGCNTQDDTGPLTTDKTPTFTFRKVPVKDKHGNPFTISPVHRSGTMLSR